MFTVETAPRLERKWKKGQLRNISEVFFQNASNGEKNKGQISIKQKYP